MKSIFDQWYDENYAKHLRHHSSYWKCKQTWLAAQQQQLGEITTLRADIAVANEENARVTEQKNKMWFEIAARDLFIKQMQAAIEGMFGPTSTLSDDRWDKLSADNGLQPSTEALYAYVKQAVEAEREACAIACSMMQESIGGWRKATHDDCSAAIRARGAA